MSFGTKQQKLYILNKKEAYKKRNQYAILNIAFPVFFIALVMGSISLYRKRKYEK